MRTAGWMPRSANLYGKRPSPAPALPFPGGGDEEAAATGDQMDKSGNGKRTPPAPPRANSGRPWSMPLMRTRMDISMELKSTSSTKISMPAR